MNHVPNGADDPQAVNIEDLSEELQAKFRNVLQFLKKESKNPFLPPEFREKFRELLQGTPDNKEHS